MSARAALLSALSGAALLSLAVSAGEPAGAAPALAEVVRGQPLSFPTDFGAHPDFGIEWWYITGWLHTPQNQQLGFQVTFFRVRSQLDDSNPSAFAARQLLIAHCAISDPTHGRLWQDQRVRREGFELAEARRGNTDVWVDDWQLHRQDEHYRAQLKADDFALDLTLQVTQPPLLNGVDGYSQKGPDARSASYYYSEPQLRVSGQIARGTQQDSVNGTAWLDHEWSSQYLQAGASGWDWIGLNLDDGGAVMAFEIRGPKEQALWAGGSLRDAQGHTQALTPQQIHFTPQRRWRSPRTGIVYPVSWQVQLADRRYELSPLMDDQENDTRQSSGAIYWEGAVRAARAGQSVGKGYLELTGYDRPLSLR